MNVNLANAKITDVKSMALNGYLKTQKISPELALGAGIVCGIGAVVVGVMRAKKVYAVVEETRKELNDIRNTQKDCEENGWPIPLDSDIKRMSTRAYITMVWKIAKELAPAIGLEAASIAFVLLSHGVLKKRYLNTTAAYAALSEAFKGYRERVKESIGEETEKFVMSAVKKENDIKVDPEDDKDGEWEDIKKEKLVVKDHKYSPYEFDFNRYSSEHWSPNPDLSNAFLCKEQERVNKLLQDRGHVFLNEVLDGLGMKRTPAGAVCGWIKGNGSNYIDFGYMETFIRDYQIDSDLCRKNIHLVFNVDGQIWDKI